MNYVQAICGFICNSVRCVDCGVMGLCGAFGGVAMTDFEYEAFERFCIMSEAIGDREAIKYIDMTYGREIALKIWNKYCTK